MRTSKREAAKREKWLSLAEDLWHNGRRSLSAGVPDPEWDRLMWLYLLATVLPVSFGEQLSYFLGVLGD